MANIERSVAIIFGGQDKVSQVISNVSKSMGQFENIAASVAEPLARIGNTIIGMEAGFATLAAGGLALATKTAGDFNDQIGEINTLTSMTSDQVAIFSKQILDYARDSQISMDDINSALYQAISLGTDYSRSLDLIATSERLAIAGKAELTSTTELLAGTLNAYGASVDSAGHYSDVFFNTVKLGKTTIPELAEALSRVTGIAANAGIPIETLTSAIAALTASGLPTTEAITGIKAAISNIIKPSEKAAQLAQELGLGFNASTLQSKGFEGVLSDIFQVTGGNVEQLGKLFESTEALNVVLSLGADKSGRFAEALKSMADVTGTTEAAYTKMANNFSRINQNLANNLKATLIDIGTPLLEKYGETASAISNLFSGISISISKGSFDPIFSAIDEFGDRAISLLNGIAEALPEALSSVDYSELINNLRDLGVTVSSVFAGLDLTDPGDLAIAFQEVIDTISSLTITTSGIIEIFKEVFKQVREGISAFNDLDEDSKQSFGNILGSAQLVVMAGAKITLAIGAITATGAEMKSVFNVIVGSLKYLWNSAESLFDLMVLNVTTAIYGILKIADIATLGMSDRIGNAMKGVENYMGGVWQTLKENTGEAIEGLGMVADSITGTAEAAEVANEKTKSFSDTVTSLPSEKTVKFGAAWDELQAMVAEEKLEGMPDSKTVDYGVLLNDEQAANVRSAMETNFPPVKEINVKPSVDLDFYKAETDRLSTIFEFKAKIDTAQIQADTERIKAAFSSVSDSISSTGDVLSSLFGDISQGDLDIATRFQIEDQIREENKRREESLELQKKLTEEQIKVMQARTDALGRGEGLITVDGAGLQPHLEAIMWEILSAVQLRVNEEYSEFLLALT